MQNKLNEAVGKSNDQNEALNTSMPSTIALDNSEVHESAPMDAQRLAIAAQRKMIEVAIERAEENIILERTEKRKKIAQIKTYLASMKKVPKKPYQSN